MDMFTYKYKIHQQSVHAHHGLPGYMYTFSTCTHINDHLNTLPDCPQNNDGHDILGLASKR